MNRWRILHGSNEKQRKAWRSYVLMRRTLPRYLARQLYCEFRLVCELPVGLGAAGR